MLIYGLFVLGFILLIKGADWLVEGSSSLARRMGLTDLIIGLTIVSLGTSMPELIVNLIASFKGSSDIAIGNVLGSNIANILLIMGASAIVNDLPIQKNTVLSEIPFSLAAALLIGFLANTAFMESNVGGGLELDRLDGAIILFFFALFILYIINIAHDASEPVGADVEVYPMPVGRAVLMVVAGMACLFFGGKWVVDGAVHLALIMGMSEAFVGLTIVAIGTSLPELVTSIIAAYKKSIDIAVGNVIGSNIFNLLFILGVSSVIRPLDFHVTSNLDLLVVVFSSAFIILALAIGRRRVVKRYDGVLFVLCYFVYIWFLIQRG
jgi:cation:H+ antiporter